MPPSMRDEFDFVEHDQWLILSHLDEMDDDNVKKVKSEQEFVCWIVHKVNEIRCWKYQSPTKTNQKYTQNMFIRRTRGLVSKEGISATKQMCGMINLLNESSTMKSHFHSSLRRWKNSREQGKLDSGNWHCQELHNTPPFLVIEQE